MVVKKGFLEKAKEFILSKSKQKQAFFDRDHELKTKITELEAKRSGIIEAYDPTKGLNQDAIDKIDAEIDAAHKEIAILTIRESKVSNYELGDLIKHVSEAKKEAEEFLENKLTEDEKIREEILATKKAFLEAQAKHYNLTREAANYASDVNESLSELTKSISIEIDRLREKARKLEREIQSLIPTGHFSEGAPYVGQAQVEVLREEYSKVRGEIARLESLIGDVGDRIWRLESRTDGNYRPIYFIHDNEQIDATQKGIVKE